MLGEEAKALGLTNGAEFHCQGASWSNPEGLGIVFCNIRSSSTKILVRTDKKFALYWLIEKGELKKRYTVTSQDF
jgi:hypothetical protein